MSFEQCVIVGTMVGVVVTMISTFKLIETLERRITNLASRIEALEKRLNETPSPNP